MMALLGAFLGALGVSDLFRASDDTTSTSRRIGVLSVGVAVLVLLLALGGTTGRDWFLVIPLVLALAAWTLASADALTAHTPRVPRVVAFVGLGAGVIVCLLVTDGDIGRWPAFLAGPITSVPYDQAVLVFGAMLVQLATANVVVRLTLQGVGVPTATGERRLKSGRVLGSMERLFILGLGMTGAFTAAAVVVAAKGLLRYPDVRAEKVDSTTEVRPNPLSEYFLIGSFASWLVAVGSLAVVVLGTSSVA